MCTEKRTAAGSSEREETLDPHDWEEFRKLGHRMLDDTVDYLCRFGKRA